MLPENGPWQGDPPSFDRLVHGEQEFVFNGPPPSQGQRLEGTTKVDKVYSKTGKRGGAMNFVETVTEFRVPGSRDVLVTMRSTLIETGQAVRP